jgi:hypothetical protein
LVSIIYDKKYYEGTFFYNKEDIVLTISEELESKIGHPIVDDAEYAEILKSILKRIVPYSEIYNRLDNVDFNRWNLK